MKSIRSICLLISTAVLLATRSQGQDVAQLKSYMDAYARSNDFQGSVSSRVIARFFSGNLMVGRIESTTSEIQTTPSSE
jgi:hypothetical protein